MSQPPMPPMNLHGAVDLSHAARASSGGTTPSKTSALVVEVTDVNFADFVQRSAQVPLIIVLGSQQAPASAQVTDLLESIARESGGRFLVGTVDVDTHPQLAAAFQVQGVPTAVAVLQGAPVPLFQGLPSREEAQQVVNQLLEAAQANGVTGTVDVGESPEESDDAPDSPLHQAAYDAIENNDLDGAVAAYEKAIAEDPSDELATAGLAQVKLMRRTQGLDPAAVRKAAADNPGDVAAQCSVADLDLLGGKVEDAFSRLIDVVRRTQGEERDQARMHLIDLFETVGTSDPRVLQARRALANALF